MLILLIFAFLAGIVTVFSPCIIPVLPAILAAGVGRGALRPLGVILGLILSFSFFTLTLTAIVQATGISPDFLRIFAVIILVFFGLVMIFPSLSEFFAKITSRVADWGQRAQSQTQQQSSITSGFLSGFLLGLALGLLWTPCAGPLLASITVLVATHAISGEAIALTFAYSLGAAIPMFLIAYGGSRALQSSRFLAKHSEGIRQSFGVLMIVTAIAIATHLDVAFQQYVLDYIPLIEIEDNPLVRDELESLKTQENLPFFEKPLTKGAENRSSPSTDKTDKSGLPKIAPAPELAGIAYWLNSPPLMLGALKGKVVLVDFWTYSCINCIRTLPYLNHWYDTYRDQGFVIIGVHSPEFEFEKSTKNVAEAIARFNIHYPVAQDNQFATWRAYGNQYWPADFLIDQEGVVREVHFGEGNYLETENAIRSLLGLPPLKKGEISEETPAKKAITPEIYLGYHRAENYESEIAEQLQKDEVIKYSFSKPLEKDEVGLRGLWKVNAESITAEGNTSQLELNFFASQVYLVLGGSSEAPLQILLDDQPLPQKYYTDDMDSHGNLFVKDPRKYDVINLHNENGRHKLTLKVPQGIQAYAFTFGLK